MRDAAIELPPENPPVQNNPTIWAVQIEVNGNQARFLGARLATGNAWPVALADRASAVRLGHVAWFEYRLQSRNGERVVSDGVAVSTSAIVEAEPRTRGYVAMGRRVVTVTVPYRPDVRTIALYGVAPSNLPPDQWRRLEQFVQPLPQVNP